MTIDEAIKHCLEVAEQQEADSFIDRLSDDDEWSESLKENCRQCAADHRQLAEWLRELQEAKRLLKVAVEDFSFVSENFINNMDSLCSMYNHIAGCVKGCPMSSSDDFGHCKWRYADEAEKLLNE